MDDDGPHLERPRRLAQQAVGGRQQVEAQRAGVAALVGVLADATRQPDQRGVGRADVTDPELGHRQVEHRVPLVGAEGHDGHHERETDDRARPPAAASRGAPRGDGPVRTAGAWSRSVTRARAYPGCTHASGHHHYVVPLVDATVEAPTVKAGRARRAAGGRPRHRSATTAGLRARRLRWPPPPRRRRAGDVGGHRRRPRAGRPSRCGASTASPAARWKRASCSTSPSCCGGATCPTSTSSTCTARDRSRPSWAGTRSSATPLAAERTFGLLQHLGIIFGLFALARPWGRLAATIVAAFAVFYVMTPIALTAMAWNGARRPDAVERGVRRAARAAPGRPRRPAAVLAGRRRPGRSGARRSGPTSIVAVGLVLGWLLWPAPATRRPVVHRRRRRADPDVGPPGHGRPGRGRSGAWSSTRCSSCGPDASCPGRRRGAGSTARSRRSPRRSRRGGASPTSRPRTPCSCGSSRWCSARSALLAFAIWQRRRPRRHHRPLDRAARRRARQRSASCPRRCSGRTRPT